MHVMYRFLTRAGAVAAAGVALSTGVVTAASASGGGGVPSHPGALSLAGIVAGGGGALRPTSNDPATGRSATPVNSTYAAGYQAKVPTGSATTSTATFTVPTLACTTTDLAIAPSTNVSVNNYKSISAAFVVTGCVNGTAVYYPGLVVNGTEHDYSSSPVAAGNVIDLTTKVSHFRTRVQVTDVTTGVTEKITGGAGASANAAFVGDYALSTSTGLLGVPNFGTLTFGNCLIDGKTLASWSPQAYQRVNSSNVVQIATGALSASGLAFTTQYQSS